MNLIDKIKKLNKVATASKYSILIAFVFVILTTLLIGCSGPPIEVNPMPAVDESIIITSTNSTSAEVMPTIAPTLSNQTIVSNISDSISQGSNVENGGQAYFSDNHIYYIKDGIYSMSKNGENKTLVSEVDDALYLNKSDDYIYYVSTSDYYVYKLNTTIEQQPIKLELEGAYFLTIIGDFLYYQYTIGADADYCLYRANKDGINSENLGIRSSSFCTDGKSIFYSNSDDNNTLYMYNISTAEVEQLSNNTVQQLNVVDNHIFYINRTTQQITKLSLETQDSIVLYDMKSSYLNNNGDVIVFANDLGISTMDFDGENVTQILEYNDINGLNVVGNYIFFALYLNNSNEKIFSIKTDGSELSEPLPEYSMSIIKSFDFENKTIIVDFVERLTGQDAIDTYAEDNSISLRRAEEKLTTTNGIYIRNTNNKQREYQVSDLTRIVLSVKTDGSYNPEGYDADCTILKEIYNLDKALILDSLFYIVGFNDELLELRQFYEQ